MSRRKKEKPDGMKGEKIKVNVDGEMVEAYFYSNRKTLTITSRIFVGKPPKVGGWAEIIGGRVLIWTEDSPDGSWLPKGFVCAMDGPDAPADNDGDWLIEGVKILNDHLEMKLIQYD